MPGYLVKVEAVEVGGTPMQIRSLLDRQQFSDPHGDALRQGISSAAWPLFGLVWPSSQVLADAMLRFDLGSKRVLEVGCGLALASLVVQRRHGDITASDCHPLAEAFLLDNLSYAFRAVQNGLVQHYALGMMIGLFLLIAAGRFLLGLY